MEGDFTFGVSGASVPGDAWLAGSWPRPGQRTACLVRKSRGKKSDEEEGRDCVSPDRFDHRTWYPIPRK